MLRLPPSGYAQHEQEPDPFVLGGAKSKGEYNVFPLHFP